MKPRSPRRPSYGLGPAGPLLAAALGLSAVLPLPVPAQEAPRAVVLTLDRLVELGLRDSYRVRQLLMDIERNRSNLRAEHAGLKSRVDMNVATPDFQRIADYKWNSQLKRNELVHENTRRWEASLSIRQPVILLGYPTNGTLSLNNRMYRYTQYSGDRDLRYYNRYFVQYQQPLFQPNRMKNQLEGAELNLERTELEFQDNVVNTVNELAGDFFELFETSYQRLMHEESLRNLERAAESAREMLAVNTGRGLEQDQLRVELANARERSQRSTSSVRLQSESLKQRLRLAVTDSIVVEPVLRVEPVAIPIERAVEFAKTLAPRLRRLAIQRRENEIRLDETRGRDGFRMNLNLTYGRETQDPEFERLWTEPRNSYTVKLDGAIPIWDWGQRKHRIQADLYSLQRTDLQVEQALAEIETNVRNEVRNLQEYEQRAVNMQTNLELARGITRSTLERYATGEATLIDVLQTINRQSATAQNFLDAYLGYRRALLRIERLTYYDFQRNAPMLDRFRIEGLQK